MAKEPLIPLTVLQLMEPNQILKKIYFFFIKKPAKRTSTAPYPPSLPCTQKKLTLFVTFFVGRIF